MKTDATFILVRPCYAGNMGSVARAIKNMGFKKLMIVNPQESPISLEARKMSVSAWDILKKAKICKSIREAAKGVEFLIATTAREGRKRGGPVSLPNLQDHIPEGKKIGILFGPEDRGLSTEEVHMCNIAVRIPSSKEMSSLNLAQAVMLLAYELRNVEPVASAAGGGKARLAPPTLPNMASVDQIETMYDHFEEMLAAIGFFPHDNPFSVMRKVRRLFSRTSLTEREVRMLRGMCHQTLRSVGEHEKKTKRAS